jgi:hypothetical protein
MSKKVWSALYLPENTVNVTHKNHPTKNKSVTFQYTWFFSNTTVRTSKSHSHLISVATSYKQIPVSNIRIITNSMQCCCCCCLMADLGFIPLVFWHPNTVLVIRWRCGPVLGTQGGDLCPLLYSLVGILCSSYCWRFLFGGGVLRDSRGLCWAGSLRLLVNALFIHLSLQIKPVFCQTQQSFLFFCVCVWQESCLICTDIHCRMEYTNVYPQFINTLRTGDEFSRLWRFFFKTLRQMTQICLLTRAWILRT